MNYTVVSGATTEAAVVGSWMPKVGPVSGFVIENDVLMPQHAQHFTQFFDAIESKQPIERALSYLTTMHKAAKNVPLVRFRGTEWFSPVNIQNKVVYVTNVNDLAHAIDRRPFIVDKSKKVLVLFPQFVVSTIQLQSSAGIELILKSDNIKQYIDDLSIDDLEKFLNPGLIDATIQFSKKQYLYIGLLSIDENHPLSGPVEIMSGDQNISTKFKRKNKYIFRNVLVEIPEYAFLGLGLNIITQDENHNFMRIFPTKPNILTVKFVDSSYEIDELTQLFTDFDKLNDAAIESFNKAEILRKSIQEKQRKLSESEQVP